MHCALQQCTTAPGPPPLPPQLPPVHTPARMRWARTHPLHWPPPTLTSAARYVQAPQPGLSQQVLQQSAAVWQHVLLPGPRSPPLKSVAPCTQHSRSGGGAAMAYCGASAAGPGLGSGFAARPATLEQEMK